MMYRCIRCGTGLVSVPKPVMEWLHDNKCQVCGHWMTEVERESLETHVDLSELTHLDLHWLRGAVITETVRRYGRKAVKWIQGETKTSLELMETRPRQIREDKSSLQIIKEVKKK